MKNIQPVIWIPVKDIVGDLSLLSPNLTYLLLQEKEDGDWIKIKLKVDDEEHIWFTQKHYWIYKTISLTS